MDQAAEILIPPHPYRHLQRIERKIRPESANSAVS
jgi:hypothetical protein